MLKKINDWLHLWLGLASGIIVFIVAVTGCILVFEHEIKSLTRPWLHTERPAGQDYQNPSVIYRNVKETFPDKKIFSIWYYGHGRTAKVSMNADSLIYVDPYTAQVVAIADDEDFFHFILDGHLGIWIEGELGHQIVSWATLIFVVLLITGLVLWWPKKWNKTNRDKSFKIKWNAKFKRVNYDLHNVLGFYALVVSLILAFTGLIMGFAWINKGVYWLASGGEEPPKYQRSFSDTTIVRDNSDFHNVDLAFRKGMNELATQNKDQIIVSFPAKPADAIYVCTDMYRGTWRDIYLDQNTLEVLPSSGKVLGDLRLADWLRRANYGLHVGAIGNMPTKIIYFIASLICASLPVTGFLVWWGKRKKKKKPTKPQARRVMKTTS